MRPSERLTSTYPSGEEPSSFLTTNHARNEEPIGTSLGMETDEKRGFGSVERGSAITQVNCFTVQKKTLSKLV